MVTPRPFRIVSFLSLSLLIPSLACGLAGSGIDPGRTTSVPLITGTPTASLPATCVLGSTRFDATVGGWVYCAVASPATWTASGAPPSGAAGGSLGGTFPNPTVVSVASVTTGTLAVGNGGTGSATQNFIDLTTNQSIAGTKSFTAVGSGNWNGFANSYVIPANVGGTADAITLAPSPAITAYQEGQEFLFDAKGTNTVASPTFQISGLAVLTASTLGSVALPIGGLANGQLYRARVEGTGPFSMRIAPYDSVSSNGDTVNGALLISMNGTTQLTTTNTGAQSTTGGSGYIGAHDAGAAMVSGNRLGFALMSGAYSGTHQIANSCGFAGFATEDWSLNNYGSSFSVYTTPNASPTRRVVATFGQDGTLSLPVAPLAVASGGTGQTSYTNGQLLVGNTTGNTLTKATLTAGAHVAVTNGAGAVTVAGDGTQTTYADAAALAAAVPCGAGTNGYVAIAMLTAVAHWYSCQNPTWTDMGLVLGATTFAGSAITSGTVGSTYGGTGQNLSASTGALSVAAGTVSAGTLGVANGGTGLATTTQGAILTGGNGTAAQVQLADVAAGAVLVSGGTSTIPAYSNTSVAISGLAPQLVLGAVAASSSGRIDLKGLTSGTTSLTVPAAAGTVTVTLPTVATTMPTAQPSTTGQVLTATTAGVQSYGTLGVVGGGTGLATLTAHALQVGNGTTALTQLGLGTATTVLHGAAAGDPTWGAVALGTDTSGNYAAGDGVAGNAAAANALKSATTTVNVSSATAPTTGQVLTATSGTAATWQTAAGGVTGFTGSETTTAPNATIYVDALTVSAASTNADLVLKQKGTGSLLATIPDSAAAGGNKRGAGVTDWQFNRAAATQVASADYSVIAGGYSNTASGAGGSTVSGGYGNTASNTYSTISGGESCTASGDHSSIGGGTTQTASGGWSRIGGGSGNTASNSYATVAGGLTNTASGFYSAVSGGGLNTASSSSSTVGGGYSNTASGISATVPGGSWATTRGINTKFAYAGNKTATLGDGQMGILVNRWTSADATPVSMTAADGFTGPLAANVNVMPNNSAYMIVAHVVCRLTTGANAGSVASWRIEALMKRGANAAATALSGAVTVTAVGGDAGAAGTAATIIADTTLGAPEIQVTGIAATTILWVGTMYTTEVTP